MILFALYVSFRTVVLVLSMVFSSVRRNFPAHNGLIAFWQASARHTRTHRRAQEKGRRTKDEGRGGGHSHNQMR